MSDLTLVDKSPEQLAKEDLVRQALDAAACELEKRSTNELYAKAFKAAAKIIRSMKLPESIPDVK